jgi:hypothetical protein
MGWHTLFVEKIRQWNALFWFGLRDVGIPLTSHNPKNNCCFSGILEHGNYLIKQAFKKLFIS